MSNAIKFKNRKVCVWDLAKQGSLAFLEVAGFPQMRLSANGEMSIYNRSLEKCAAIYSIANN